MEKPIRQIKFLVGACGAGKSTYAETHKDDFAGYKLIAKDDITKNYLTDPKTGKTLTMDQAWENNADAIRKDFNDAVQAAVDAGENILIDRFMATQEARAVTLKISKSSGKYDYRTTAIIIHPPEEEEHARRMFARSVRENRFEAIGAMDGLEPIKKGEYDNIIE